MENGGIDSAKERTGIWLFTDFIFFVLPSFLFFHDDPNKNPGLKAGHEGDLCGGLGSEGDLTVSH